MDLKTYIRNQVIEAQRFKWNKGVQMGHDPGEQAIEEWILRYAENYKQSYEACYKRVVDKVFKTSVEKLKKLHDDLREEEINQLVQEVISDFTKQWTMEMANERNGHTEEI